MKSIQEVEQEIVDEFEILGDDKESTIFYLMEIGTRLPILSEEDKTEDHIIKGCQSKVWLTAEMIDEKVTFKADSNTDITKGLIYLLIRVLSGRMPAEILSAELTFIERIGMGNILGSQRSNGFTAMIKQMKMYALAFQTKIQA
jgi:cysteine desulfuration protein SufE